MKALVGLLFLVFIVWNGLAIARRERRSGEVQDYGHPIKDNLLLLASAIFLAGAMMAGFRWVEKKTHEVDALGRPLFLAIFLPLAAGISYLANRFLRGGR
jgi:drug/metabolite transporter (DMT)-like permease